MTGRAKWAWCLAGLAVAVGLPLAAHWARPTPAGCALDGLPINAAYRVAVVDAAGGVHEFCCPRCAQLWLGRQATPPRAITVTDEATGREIDAAAAWYVRSSVVTMPSTGNGVHAFASRTDAEHHAATCAGTVLPEAEKPFP